MFPQTFDSFPNNTDGNEYMKLLVLVETDSQRTTDKNIKIGASEAQTTANIEEQSTTGNPPTK